MVKKQGKVIVLLFISIVVVFWISIKAVECIKNGCKIFSSDENLSSIEKRISDGSKVGKIFVKYSGLDADSQKFQQLKSSGKFQQARNDFRQLGTEFCADPEVLIYLNNQKIVGESYTIAVPVPIGDSNENERNFALEILRGAAQAQDEINKSDKKINGKPLKILIVNDDYNDSSTTNDIANLLLKDKNVLGVVGHGTSTATKTAMNIYSQTKYGENRLVSISPSSTSTSINPNPASEYFFRTIPNNRNQANILAEYILKNLKIEKAAIVWNSENDNYSESLKNEFKRSFEQRIDGVTGNVVLIYDIKTNFNTNFVDEATQKEVGVFVLTINIGSVERTSSRITPRDDAQKFSYVGGDATYGRNILQKRFRNMVVTTAWHKNNNSEKSLKFVNAANNLWCQASSNDEKEKITAYTATAYDATKLFINALLDTSKNSTPTRQAIKENLQQYKLTQNPVGKKVFFEGVTGNINFTASGDTTTKSQLVRVCEIEENKYVYKLERPDNPNWDRNKCN